MRGCYLKSGGSTPPRGVCITYWVMWPGHEPPWPNFALFLIPLLVINLSAKFEFSNFNRPWNIEGVAKISKVRHVTPSWLHWPNFAFFRHCCLCSICVPNFKYLASNVPEIYRVPKNSRSGSRDPTDPITTLFELILHFSIILFVINFYAKFDISSFISSRDIEGIPKF